VWVEEEGEVTEKYWKRSMEGSDWCLPNPRLHGFTAARCRPNNTMIPSSSHFNHPSPCGVLDLSTSRRTEYLPEWYRHGTCTGSRRIDGLSGNASFNQLGYHRLSWEVNSTWELGSHTSKHPSGSLLSLGPLHLHLPWYGIQTTQASVC
jgi:hypothetical protein